MKRKVLSIVVLAAVAMLAFASVAHAASSTTTAILKDAQDGTLDGHYTAAQVRAALAAVKSDPTLQMYTDVEGVLEAYLASLPSPGVASSGGLMFTGGPVLWLFAAGAGLMATGLVLRRRRAEA